MEYDREEVERRVLRFRSFRRAEDWQTIESAFESSIQYVSHTWFVAGSEPSDIAQSMRLMLLSAADSWNPNRHASFRTYFWGIARNCLKDMIAERRTADVRDNESQWDDSLGWEPEGIGGRKDLERIQLMYDIATLPVTDRQRQVILGLLEGKEKQDIAKELNLSGGAISWEVKALQQNEAVREYFERRP